MFTGIITHFGTIDKISHTVGDDKNWRDMTIGVITNMDVNSIDLGASIAHNGVCLTVTHKKNRTDGGYFEADVSIETLQKSTMNDWTVGKIINLERALKIGDELGGHLVSGHVDTTTDIIRITPDGDSQRFMFTMPCKYDTMIAPKGSIVINGVSLTVNEVTDRDFSVNIIPHTLQHTTFGTLQQGDIVNIEVDMMARYVAQYLAKKGL